MAKQFLNVAEVGATVQQVSCERMSQGVRTDVVNPGAESNVLFYKTAY